MSTIHDYIATMEAAPVDNPTGDGFGVLPLPTGTATGTSGVVGVASLSALSGDGHADWATFGAATLPALTGDGTEAGYHPAWGDSTLPALAGDGTAHVLIESVGLLPPLFGIGYCGATAEATLPALTGDAIDDSFDVTATGAAMLPAVSGEALVCGLDKPIASGATSAAVVNLLQQGNATIAAAAASICAHDDTDDERAMSVVYFVSNLMTYVQDGDGIGDRWTCALATWMRRYGDCEDGAILIHALLLAAGVEPGRIRTAFGLAMKTDLITIGHAWVMYRRRTDEEWIPLEWTFQPSPYDIEAAIINRQVDMADTYTKISYVLTNESFGPVNDANYIANLAANRSTVSAGLPALAATGQTGQAAQGAVSLFAGTLATTLAASGQTGARVAISMPMMAGGGFGSQLATGTASCVAPSLGGSGNTGAMAAATLARAAATGQCGTSGKADVALPILALSTTGMAATLAGADLLLSRPVAQGAGVAGIMADGGDLDFPSLRPTGRAAQGPFVRSSCVLPRLATVGEASPLSTGTGDLFIQGLAVRAQGKQAVSWTGPLIYSGMRWT